MKGNSDRSSLQGRQAALQYAVLRDYCDSDPQSSADLS